MYRRLLVPIDGSPCSARAVRHALELARAVGAEVAFLHALDDPKSVVYTMSESASYLPQLYSDQKRGAVDALNRAQELALQANVRARTVLIEHTDPVEAICQAEKDFDLIVMATHGRNGISRWLFGSVAEGALRVSSKPCLMVHCSHGRDELVSNAEHGLLREESGHANA
ncbi:MAG: universal stress protein [Trueperaceae bacterium]|nr:MAG: universal stress protein [Trueperaceae bacterium]